MRVWRRAACFVFGGSLLIISGKMLYGHLGSSAVQAGHLSFVLLSALGLMAFLGVILVAEATFSGLRRR